MEAALLRHGIKLHEERDSDLCSASGVRVILTNYDPAADQGFIDCALREAPISTGPLAKKETPADQIEYSLANSECSLYLRGSRRSQEKDQARNLLAAFKDLEHGLALKG